MACTECHIKYLDKLKGFFREVDQKRSPVLVLFNTNDAFDKKFKSLNKKLPKSEVINTFLTRNDTVILAGNPVYNPKLKELFIAQSKK